MVKMVMPKEVDELVGFVPFVPGLSAKETIAVSFAANYTRISQPALNVIGAPEYVVIFLDYQTQRMMVCPAKKSTPNTFKLKQMGKTNRRNLIMARALASEVARLTERETVIGLSCVGHKAESAQPSLIFDFADLKRTKDL